MLLKKQGTSISSALTPCSPKPYSFFAWFPDLYFVLQKSSYIIHFCNIGTINCSVVCLLFTQQQMHILLNLEKF
jgi:hypothetical protein